MKKFFLFLCLLIPVESQAAWSLVTGQFISCTSTTSQASTTCTLPNNPTNGNSVFVFATVGSTRTCSVSDGTNSYTATTNAPDTNANRGLRAYIFYKLNITSGNKVITINSVGGNSVIDGFAIEFSSSGGTATFVHDAVNGTTNSSTTPNLPSLSATTGNLLIGGIGATNPTNASNSPWTGISTIQTTSAAQYYIEASTESRAISISQTANSQWAGMAAEFNPGTPTTGSASKNLNLLGVGH